MENSKLSSIACAVFALAVGTAGAQTEFRLVNGINSAFGEFWQTPNQIGPSSWFDIDSDVHAPPTVVLGSVAGTSRVQYDLFGPWGPNLATVVPWAEASLSLESLACGELVITADVALNLGRFDSLTGGNLANPSDPLFNTQPDIPWLLSNNVPAFSGELGAGYGFELEVFVDTCDVCLPSGIFEVDLDSTPPGTFEPWSDGCLPDGTHRVRLLGGEVSEMFTFSWDPNAPGGPELILPTGVNFSRMIQIPTPSSAALAAIGLSLVVRRRR